MKKIKRTGQLKTKKSKNDGGNGACNLSTGAWNQTFGPSSASQLLSNAKRVSQSTELPTNHSLPVQQLSASSSQLQSNTSNNSQSDVAPTSSRSQIQQLVAVNQIDEEVVTETPAAELSQPVQNSEQLADKSSAEQDASVSKKRGRGPNKHKHAPPNPSSRKIITTLNDENFLENDIVQALTKGIQLHFTDAWPTWKKVLGNVREEIWLKFQALFSWPPEDTAVVKKIWEKSCKDRSRGMLEDERKNAKKHFKTSDIAQCRGYNMGWIRADIWDRLIDEHWNTPSWKKKSEINKRNRVTEKEGSITKHTGGSVPFTVHAYRMTKELNRPVNFKEVFDRCHKRQKGRGDYVDLKSKAVSESYTCSLEQKYGPDGDTQPEFDPAAWCEAIGGIKTTRTHVYGFGTASRGKQIFDPSYSPPETSSSVCGPSIGRPRSSSVEVDELRHEMNERLSKQDDKMDTIVQSNADLKDAILKMSQMLTSISSIHSQNAGVPPQATQNAPVLHESSDSKSESDDDYGD